MSARPVLEARYGVARAWLCADPCSVCDRALDAATPEPIAPAAQGSMRPMLLAAAACDVHETTFRLSTADGAYALTMRGAEADRGLDRKVWSLLWNTVSRFDDVDSLRADRALAVLRHRDAWGAVGGDEAVLRDRLLRAVLWATHGFEAGQALEWVALGVDDPMNAVRWNGAGLGLSEAKRWIPAGVPNPRQARDWVSAGRSAEDIPAGFTHAAGWAFTQIAGVPAAAAWGKLLMVASPGFARFGFDSGYSPRAVEALARAFTFTDPRWKQNLTRAEYRWVDLEVMGAWPEEMVEDCESGAAVLDGLDWADAAVCIRAGLSPEETEEHLFSGADMGPIRMMAALNR